MKKRIVIFFGVILCVLPMNLFAKTICFSTGGGDYFYFSGGKVDEKPFSGNLISASGNCDVPGWATIVKDALGNHHITINTTHHPVTLCPNVWWYANGATTQSMSGEFDSSQDGTNDGLFTLTEVNCNSVPSAMPASLEK